MIDSVIYERDIDTDSLDNEVWHYINNIDSLYNECICENYEQSDDLEDDMEYILNNFSDVEVCEALSSIVAEKSNSPLTDIVPPNKYELAIKLIARDIIPVLSDIQEQYRNLLDIKFAMADD